MVGLATVESYLTSLPGGVAAYPGCTHKMDSLVVWLRRSPTTGLAERLPPEFATLVESADAQPDWVSGVGAVAVYLALRELHFAADDAYLAHARACNRAVLETPANRVLFWCATPKAIMRAATLRWNTLYRGSALEVRITGDSSVEVALSYPARLFPEIILQGFATGFAVALENAGARHVVFNLRGVDTTRALFVGRWR